MTGYRAFGLVIGSEVPLPGLPETGEGPPDFVLSLRQGGPIRCAPLDRPRRRRLSDGRLAPAVGRHGSRYLVRFAGFADFIVSSDGREILCLARRRTPVEAITHLFLAQVLPLALSRQGRLVLHASAVVTAHGAVAFLGAAGQGKSTLSTSFVRRTLPLLTDDGLLLLETGEGLAGVPSYPEIRLWPDALAALEDLGVEVRNVARSTGKTRLPVGHGPLPFSREPAPVRRMYVLGGAEPGGALDVAITRLPPREAFIELVKHAYRLDVDDRARLREEFEAIGRIVSRSALYRLAFARDLARLPAVQAAILEHLVA